MATVLTFTNRKGGVGKTITAVAYAAHCVSAGRRVLVVDLDAQGNAGKALGARPDAPNVLDVITGEVSIKEAIQAPRNEGYGVIAASDNPMPDVVIDALPEKTSRLSSALEEVDGLFDVVIIDTPPALGYLTTNALVASDYVVIPATAEADSIEGVIKTAKTVLSIQRGPNRNLKIAGVLATSFRRVTSLHRQGLCRLADIADQMGSSLFSQTIRQATAAGESIAARQSIFKYAPGSDVAIDYLDFCIELDERTA